MTAQYLLDCMLTRILEDCTHFKHLLNFAQGWYIDLARYRITPTVTLFSNPPIAILSILKILIIEYTMKGEVLEVRT